jgi:hypothetical protein
LEDRRLLAGVTIGNSFDVVNGDTSSIAALVASDGGDGISLREAIEAANATAGPDEITFDASLSGATITLGGTELEITEALTIDARPLAENVTIDADQESRILNITAATGAFTLGGLTLTGGRTTADGFDQGGGAIRSLTSGNLTIDQCTVSGNRVSGDAARGGGIYSRFGALNITECTISGNRTEGRFGSGGGVYARSDAILTESTISGNSTLGDGAFGGGIHVEGDVMLVRSTVSGNRTQGTASYGGGIHADGDQNYYGQRPGNVTLIESTVSGNRTEGDIADGGGIRAFGAVMLTDSDISDNHGNSYGGGIFAYGVTVTDSSITGNSAARYGGGINSFGAVTLAGSTVSGNRSEVGGGVAGFGGVTITESTVSGNRSTGDGGGVWSRSTLSVTRSTITDNHATGADSMGADSTGGGLFQFDTTSDRPVSISGSIIAGNTATGGGEDLAADPESTLTVNYSLIGVAEGLTFDGDVGNQTGTAAIPLDPLLGPLANNGGTSKTHALLPGSPALNAGDPAAIAGENGVPEFDQRGDGFARVAVGGVNGLQIDIGAYESQSTPQFPDGDYNHDGIASAADFVLWRNTKGQNVPNGTAADGSGNGMIDDADYDFWRANYGNTTTVDTAGSGSTLAIAPLENVAKSTRQVDDVEMSLALDVATFGHRTGSGPPLPDRFDSFDDVDFVDDHLLLLLSMDRVARFSPQFDGASEDGGIDGLFDEDNDDLSWADALLTAGKHPFAPVDVGVFE